MHHSGAIVPREGEAVFGYPKSEFAGWVERTRNPSMTLMGFAEPVIGRAFARPVGSTHPTP